jgi:MerR family transcriptional regulator/heat shock protein HspR
VSERATTRRDEGRDRAVYIISVAAELSGVHPQTLRIYERKGLLQPARTSGNTRRYSEKDIARLREIQRLTQEEGVNLAGAKRIMELESRLERTRAQLAATREELQRLRREVARRRPGQLVLRSQMQDLFGGDSWT